jgi:hypothetical protein
MIALAAKLGSLNSRFGARIALLRSKSDRMSKRVFVTGGTGKRSEPSHWHQMHSLPYDQEQMVPTCAKHLSPQGITSWHSCAILTSPKQPSCFPWALSCSRVTQSVWCNFVCVAPPVAHVCTFWQRSHASRLVPNGESGHVRLGGVDVGELGGLHHSPAPLLHALLTHTPPLLLSMAGRLLGRTSHQKECSQGCIACCSVHVYGV